MNAKLRDEMLMTMGQIQGMVSRLTPHLGNIRVECQLRRKALDSGDDSDPASPYYVKAFEITLEFLEKIVQLESELGHLRVRIPNGSNGD